MEDLGSIPGLGRSLGGGHGNPLQYPCLENPHGQQSLAGYSPRRHKELDTTERLSTQHSKSSIEGRQNRTYAEMGNQITKTSPQPMTISGHDKRDTIGSLDLLLFSERG